VSVEDGKGGRGASGRPLIEYPLVYAFKVMGLAADGFAAHAQELVTGAAGTEAELAVAVRASAAGKYHSVSISVRLESEAQRRAVYAALHADARVVYYL
jgi:putative lipoic acid-binding regulatory protein